MTSLFDSVDRTPPANFDRIARWYRGLEYATFGSHLRETRTCFLLRLQDRRQALLFGDGDGRFLARLLAQNPLLTADVVDTSAEMLNLLRVRASPFAPEVTGVSRLRTHHQDALTYSPTHPPDLVVTHFFLDCLTETQVQTFVRQLTPFFEPGTLWLVSEFQVPEGVFAFPARELVRTLYLAFRLLTGLRVKRLPEYRTPLREAGFVRIAFRSRLFGLLVSELWQKQADAIERGLGYAHT